MTGIDTNVLVRVLAKDDPLQVERVRKFFDRSRESGEVVYISAIVLCETVWVLRFETAVASVSFLEAGAIGLNPAPAGAVSYLPRIFGSASTPACATMPSCWEVTPLTPMAPSTWPSWVIGRPPSKGKTPGMATTPVSPCRIRSL